MRRLMIALIVLVTLTGVLAIAAPTLATESCETQTLSYQVVLDWAIQAEHLHTITVQNFKWYIIPDGGPQTIVYELTYYDLSGSIVVKSGKITLSDTCTPEFKDATSGSRWTCDTSKIVDIYHEILASGSGEITVLDFDAWTVNFGHKNWSAYAEVDAWHAYYEYLLSLGIKVTTSTTVCGVRGVPSTTETMLYQFNNAQFYGAPVTYWFEQSSGHRELIRHDFVSNDPGNGNVGVLSVVLPPAVYPADADYGVYQTNDGQIGVWGIIVAEVYGVDVQRVIVASTEGYAEPDVYYLGADTVNEIPRASTPINWAWR